MGNIVGRVWGYFFHEVKTPKKILILGLDNAGKTTILNQLSKKFDINSMKTVVNTTNTTCPTIGFNVDTIEHENISMTVFDLGGGARLRSMWNYYYDNVDAIIYVIDGSDFERYDEAAEELMNVLQNPKVKISNILIYVNKSDLTGTENMTMLQHILNLEKIKSQRWKICQISAIKGEGIVDGLSWLVKVLS